jgi:hypothetical protein
MARARSQRRFAMPVRLLWQITVLPAFRQIEGIRVVEPAELVALKAIAVARGKACGRRHRHLSA